MAYYIKPYSQKFSCFSIWRKVKRLRDFKADEGVEYIVRKNKKDVDVGDTLPIYIGIDGKLQKCSSYALYLF